MKSSAVLLLFLGSLAEAFPSPKGLVKPYDTVDHHDIGGGPEPPAKARIIDNPNPGGDRTVTSTTTAMEGQATDDGKGIPKGTPTSDCISRYCKDGRELCHYWEAPWGRYDPLTGEWEHGGMVIMDIGSCT